MPTIIPPGRQRPLRSGGGSRPDETGNIFAGNAQLQERLGAFLEALPQEYKFREAQSLPPLQDDITVDITREELPSGVRTPHVHITFLPRPGTGEGTLQLLFAVGSDQLHINVATAGDARNGTGGLMCTVAPCFFAKVVEASESCKEVGSMLLAGSMKNDLLEGRGVQSPTLPYQIDFVQELIHLLQRLETMTLAEFYDFASARDSIHPRDFLGPTWQSDKPVLYVDHAIEITPM